MTLPMSLDLPRRFYLRRVVDETGVSGTGVVAHGVAFPDGLVALRWASEFPTSVVFHERGIESVEAIHGHNGNTRIVWVDGDPDPDDPTSGWEPDSDLR